MGFRVIHSNVQQGIGKLGRGAVARHLGEMRPRLGLDAAENVGRSATPILGIPTGYPSRLHRHRRPDFLMQNHRLFVDTHPRLPYRQRLFIHCQPILHARDVFLIEFGHAPHFFPATASGRGFRAGFGPFLVPPAAPACALLLPPLASAPSTAPAPRAADCKPRLRCAAAAGHPTALLSPAAPLVQGPLQSGLLIALASQPYRLWGQPNITG